MCIVERGQLICITALVHIIYPDINKESMWVFLTGYFQMKRKKQQHDDPLHNISLEGWKDK